MRKKISHGQIKKWNDEKAFGFIEPADGGKDIFVHINNCKDKSNRPDIGQLVAYSLARDKDNRLFAAHVTKAGDRMRSKRENHSGSNKMLSIIIAGLFLGVVATLVFKGKLTEVILYYYLIASFICFIAYANDKSAAKNGRWRTPESTLHSFALVGGWPGALIAQQTLRHKSSKKDFRNLCWLTVVVNTLGFAWLFTDQG